MPDRRTRKSLVHYDVTSNFGGGRNSNYLCIIRECIIVKWQRGNLLCKIVSSTNLVFLCFFFVN
jgi:hypothetical protein